MLTNSAPIFYITVFLLDKCRSMTYSQGYGLQQDLISRTSVPIFQLAFPSLISPLVHPALGPFTKSRAPHDDETSH